MCTSKFHRVTTVRKLESWSLNKKVREDFRKSFIFVMRSYVKSIYDCAWLKINVTKIIKFHSTIPFIIVTLCIVCCSSSYMYYYTLIISGHFLQIFPIILVFFNYFTRGRKIKSKKKIKIYQFSTSYILLLTCHI